MVLIFSVYLRSKVKNLNGMFLEEYDVIVVGAGHAGCDAAAAAAPDGSRMCDDPHHDADLGHTDPNTFGTKRRKIATRQPRTTTTATATGVRLDITDPADRDRIPADGPDPAGDPA